MQRETYGLYGSGGGMSTVDGGAYELKSPMPSVDGGGGGMKSSSAEHPPVEGGGGGIELSSTPRLRPAELTELTMLFSWIGRLLLESEAFTVLSPDLISSPLLSLELLLLLLLLLLLPL